MTTDYKVADYTKAKRAARAVLAKNYITDIPVSIMGIIENYGIKVESRRFDAPYNNVAGFISLHDGLIVVNQDDPPNRRKFTLAHELGHLVLHRDALLNDKNRSILYRMPIGQTNTDPLEREANCFAANILVPDEFLEIYENEGTDVIARMFDVSVDVAGFRLVSRK